MSHPGAASSDAPAAHRAPSMRAPSPDRYQSLTSGPSHYEMAGPFPRIPWIIRGNRPAAPTHGRTDHGRVYSHRARRPQGDDRGRRAAPRRKRLRGARDPEHPRGAAQAPCPLPGPSQPKDLLRGRTDRLRDPPAHQLAGHRLRGDRPLADPAALRGARQDRPHRRAQPGPPAARRRAHGGARADPDRGGAARPGAGARGPQERPPHRQAEGQELPAALRQALPGTRRPLELPLRGLLCAPSSSRSPPRRPPSTTSSAPTRSATRSSRRSTSRSRRRPARRHSPRPLRACAPSAASTRSAP